MLPSDNQSNPALLIIEFGTAAVVAAASFAWPGVADTLFHSIERFFTRLARRRGLAALVVGSSALLLRLALLPLFPIPFPIVPDDFSFLLAADTFAHGRLTNPTPALWSHFETIHETMLPSYQSMYFPGQGLVLGAGQALFGHPWFALLLVTALMCALLTWMLQAWLPPTWALLGAFVAVIRLGLFSDWINTYHTAGSLSALGGALILGALPRLMRTARFHYGLLMGLGIAILGLTRPYEGLLLCIPVAIVLGHWAWKGSNRPPARVLVRRAALPLALVVAAGAWLGYYDHVVFGSATTLPYTIDHATYGAPPYYIWQHPTAAPYYRHEFIRAFYQQGLDAQCYNSAHSLKGFLPYTLTKTWFTVLFYAGFTLLLPLLIGIHAFVDRRMRFLSLCLLVMAAGLSIEIYLVPYYIAPFLPAIYALGVQALRHLRQWRPEAKPVGLAMVRLTVASCVALAGLRCFAQPLHLGPAEWPPSNWIFTWFGPAYFGEERAQIQQRLEQLPGRQLVFVRYGPDHYPLDQWIYNAADLADAKVIWADDMSAAQNQQLLNQYRGRTAWLVEPDAVPARILPYPADQKLAAR